MKTKKDSLKLSVSRRKFIKSTGMLASGMCLTGLSNYIEGQAGKEKLALKGGIKTATEDLAGNLQVGPSVKQRGFEVRATQDTGWNIFLRKSWSTLPSDISVNYRHLDYLSQSGVNWLLVFWTNAPEFNDAWIKASEYAHKLGLRLGRAVYGFGGGGPETSMAEPNVPEQLL